MYVNSMQNQKDAIQDTDFTKIFPFSMYNSIQFQFQFNFDQQSALKGQEENCTINTHNAQ